MTQKPFKYEGWLYGLAFLIAVGLRLPGLGYIPLNETEARLALEALRLAAGLKQALSPHPGYILSTASLFFLYGGGADALARLVPALVGSALTCAPLLFRDRLKPRPGLILAFFIALDPGLVAISRQAASPVLAITCLVFSLGFFNQRKFLMAGVFAALALLGGPSIWMGLLGLGLALALYQAAKLHFVDKRPAFNFSFDAVERNTFFIAMAAALIIGGTFFFLAPNGLSAAIASIPAYLSGWRTVPQTGASLLLIALAVYQPFALILAFLAIIRGWVQASRKIVFLHLWLFVSVILALLYPARQVSDLAWSLIPLNALAALELVRFLRVRLEERKEALGAIGLTLFLWLFAWMNLTAMSRSLGAPGAYQQHLILAVGALALLPISVVLIWLGWSLRVAQVSLIWGLGIALGVLSFAGALGVTGARGLDYPEIWQLQDRPLQASLLVATVDDLSEWGKGYDHAVPATIIGLNSPALEWALRKNSPSVENFVNTEQPQQLIISTFEFDPNSSAPYRGQDFLWRSNVNWSTAQPADWFKWLFLREMPQTSENIILWADNNLFINAKK
ncbi:MAG: hypothetical protein IT310_02980 [Anaerolineales bacterium]|nr:hypothetical protein [Anaerolineales bacterium]